MTSAKSIVLWDNHHRTDTCLKHYTLALKWGDIAYLGHMTLKGPMSLIKCNCLIGAKVWKKKMKTPISSLLLYLLQKQFFKSICFFCKIILNEFHISRNLNVASAHNNFISWCIMNTFFLAQFIRIQQFWVLVSF